MVPIRRFPGNVGRDPQSGGSPFEGKFVSAQYVYPAQALAAPESSNLAEIWQRLWSKRFWIVSLAVAGLALGILAGLIQTPIYRAHTTLEMEGLNENYLNLRDVNPTTSSNYEATYLQTQVRTIESETIARRVATALNLDQPNPAPRATAKLHEWAAKLGYSPGRSLTADEVAVQNASKGLEVHTILESRMIEIYYQASDPGLAARSANAFANEYISYSLDSRWKYAQENTAWLQGQLANVKSQLQRSEQRLQDYAHASDLVYLSNRESIAEDKIRKLQLDLANAQVDRMAKQSQYEIAMASHLAALPGDETRRLASFEIALIDLRKQLADLSSKFTPAHPKVVQVSQQVADMEAVLQKEQQRLVERMHNDYEAARRREQLLTAGYDAQMKVLGQQSEKSTTYELLKHEVITTQQVYDSLFQKVKETELASALRAINIRVLDPARPPAQPYSPNPKLNAAIGGVSGFMLGIGIVLIWRPSERWLRRPGDSPRYLNVPELGVIPSAKAELASGCGLNNGGAGFHHEPDLAARTRRTSMLAESFRSAVASILFTASQREKPQVLAVTSLDQGEGKTTVVSNLGIALAEAKFRVLLVDADLRRPQLHKIFGLNNTEGLADLLDKSTPLTLSSISALARQTRVPGVRLLLSGARHNERIGAMQSRRMSQILTSLKTQFDIVLIDTPPAWLLETRIITNLASGVILVARAGETKLERLAACYQRLVEDNACVLGTILNDWNPKDGPGQNSYYAEHYYQSDK